MFIKGLLTALIIASCAAHARVDGTANQWDERQVFMTFPEWARVGIQHELPGDYEMPPTGFDKEISGAEAVNQYLSSPDDSLKDASCARNAIVKNVAKAGSSQIVGIQMYESLGRYCDVYIGIGFLGSLQRTQYFKATYRLPDGTTKSSWAATCRSNSNEWRTSYWDCGTILSGFAGK